MMMMVVVVIVMIMIWWWRLGGHYGLMDIMHLNFVHTNSNMLHWWQKLARTICGHTMQAERDENWKLEKNNNGDYGLRESCLIALAAEGESEKPGNIFSRFCTRKTCSGLFTLTRLEGKLSWIWFYVEHSGLKSCKGGFPQNGMIPNQKGVGATKLIWLATFRSSVTVIDKFS